MITLYGFRRIFPGGTGETKDLWIQWALEETGLPYRVHGLDQTQGELDSAAYSALSPFKQVPVIDDDGFVLAESAAIVLYLGEKSGRLMPRESHQRMLVTQWCLAAMSTLYTTFMCRDLVEMFDQDRAATKLHAEVRKLCDRWLADLERHLQRQEWMATAEITVADIMMAGVLRTIRKTDLMQPYPRVHAYFERCQARPAWQRTLELSAERLGVDIDSIR